MNLVEEFRKTLDHLVQNYEDYTDKVLSIDMIYSKESSTTIYRLELSIGVNDLRNHKEFIDFLKPLLDSVEGDAIYDNKGPSIIITINNRLLDTLDVENVSKSLLNGAKFKIF
jgi:hypothetical protein